MRLRPGLVLLIALAGCAPDARVSGLAIRDPLGLIDDVYDSGHELRLYVLPSDPYACDPTTGLVAADVPDLEPGMFEDAIVDISLGRADTARSEVQVPAGSWSVLVRGKGTNAGGEMNVLIATGCGAATVEVGQTLEVAVLLAPVVSAGTCGNAVLTQDEQCEGGADCTDCRTTPEPINTTTAGPQQRVRIGVRSGQRTVAVWDDLGVSPPSIALRYFHPDARRLEGMGTLLTDTTIDAVVGSLPGVQTTASVAVGGDGRVAIAYADLSGATQPDVRAVFLGQSRVVMGTPQALRADATGAQNNPAIAISGDNATMVVFEDAQSATGLSGRVFAAGSATPAGSEAFPVGTGRTGGSAPAIAATASGFVVAFVAGGDVFFQRFGSDGAELAAAEPIAGTGTGRSAPAIAAAGDGSFLVAWAEANSDGAGSGIRAAIVSPAGVPGAAFTVNSTTAGEQTRPSVAGAGASFLVAFESGGSVRARAFAVGGDPALNRERPPSFADFEVAAAGAQPNAALIGAGATEAWWVAYQAPGVDTDVFARRFPL